MNLKSFIRGAIVVAFCGYAIVLTSTRPDDVFIFYRYAENLAHGLGFAFNPPERVEGVTSLLWPLLLSLFARLSLSPESVAPLASLLAGSLVVWRLPLISARLQGREGVEWRDLWAAALTAAVAPFAYWSYSGMETALFALLLLLTIELFLSHATLSFYASALVAAAAVTVRPEMMALLPGFVLYEILKTRRTRHQVLCWTAIVAVLIGALFVWRFSYFGYWLPNTYYAKRGHPLFTTLMFGAHYCFVNARLLLPITPSPLINAALGASAIGGVLRWGFDRQQAMLLSLITGLLIFAVAYDGGDWMPLGRLLVPTLPLLSLIAVMALSDNKAGRVVLTVFVAISLAFGFYQRFGSDGELNPSAFPPLDYAPFVAHLRQHARSDDIIALMDIGEIGYRTKL